MPVFALPGHSVVLLMPSKAPQTHPQQQRPHLTGISDTPSHLSLQRFHLPKGIVQLPPDRSQQKGLKGSEWPLMAFTEDLGFTCDEITLREPFPPPSGGQCRTNVLFKRAPVEEAESPGGTCNENPSKAQPGQALFTSAFNSSAPPSFPLPWGSIWLWGPVSTAVAR